MGGETDAAAMLRGGRSRAAYPQPDAYARRARLRVPDGRHSRGGGSGAADSRGTLVYASAIDGSAVIGYGSVEAAHAALVQLQQARGVAEVALQVIQAFDERN
jgi:hypothetical protein